MKELTLRATVENILTVTAFAEEYLESLDLPLKAIMEINIAIDELFGNIAQYAYGETTGSVTVQFEAYENPRSVAITFIDSGVPYNPLSKEDPDITLSAEERKIGGLGVYMVKKSMDAISYEYKDKKNILKIRKNY